jgi:hypothetical protein
MNQSELPSTAVQEAPPPGPFNTDSSERYRTIDGTGGDDREVENHNRMSEGDGTNGRNDGSSGAQNNRDQESGGNPSVLIVGGQAGIDGRTNASDAVRHGKYRQQWRNEEKSCIDDLTRN